MANTERERTHLDTKIRIFEDMLLRSKNRSEQETLQKELMKMRRSLQVMSWN